MKGKKKIKSLDALMFIHGLCYSSTLVNEGAACL